MNLIIHTSHKAVTLDVSFVVLTVYNDGVDGHFLPGIRRARCRFLLFRVSQGS